MARIVVVTRCIAAVICIVLFAMPATAGTLASGAGPKITAPVGVVTAAQGAQVSQITARDGTTLYAGDTLATDAAGSLRVRFGASQLMLGPGTVVKLVDAIHGVAAVLQHGLVRFAESGSPIELRVLAAIVRPQEGAAGEVVIVGPSEFQIASTKGDLDVEIDGVIKTVGESTAYDVTLVPEPDHANDKRVIKQKALWIPISIVALLTILAVTSSTLSRSKF